MAKGKVKLTEEQKERNAQILARLQAERRRLFEDTRQLQADWRRRRAERLARRRRARQAQQEKTRTSSMPAPEPE